MIYAPVAVTTLNRYDHLKELIESLENNTWVEHTDLIVSLDYPPNDKYVEGYEKVKEYLYYKKEHNVFKNFILFEHDSNLGPSDNSRWVNEYLIRNYDRWIKAEDDIVFAPNFLMYIDKGLELFEHDQEVEGICGCHDLRGYSFKGNVAKQIWSHPHGVGVWRDRYINSREKYNDVLFNPDNYSFKSVFKLFKLSKYLFMFYICYVLCADRIGWMWINENTIRFFDTSHTLYVFFTNKCYVVPEKCKSHTCGIDGTGVHEVDNVIDPDEAWPLDTYTTFDYDIPENFKVERSSYKALNRVFRVGTIYLIYAWFQYLVFRLSGNNWKVVNKMVHGFRKLLRKGQNE